MFTYQFVEDAQHWNLQRSSVSVESLLPQSAIGLTDEIDSQAVFISNLSVARVASR